LKESKPKSPKILQMRSRVLRDVKKRGEARVDKDQLDPEEAFLYTLDLLLEDFGKRHLPDRCVICNPMQVLGMHRDAAMVRMLVTLFETFFPVWDEYVLEIKDSVLQGLLDRRGKRTYGSWKEKFLELVEQQVKTDLHDFQKDIENHLRKFASVEIEPIRAEEVFAAALKQLKESWMRRST